MGLVRHPSEGILVIGTPVSMKLCAPLSATGTTTYDCISSKVIAFATIDYQNTDLMTATNYIKREQVPCTSPRCIHLFLRLEVCGKVI